MATVKTVCPRAFWDFAPQGTEAPYAVLQAIGGRPLRYVDKTAASQRHTVMQITVWAPDRSAATGASRAIEDALCASQTFTAMPRSEPLSTADPDTRLRGSIQDFDIHAAR